MFALAVVAFVIVMLVFAGRKLLCQRKKAGIRSWVQDQDLDGKGSRVYRNAELGLSCKPDVIERNRIIEYKSATVNGRPRHSDVLYVAAQMLVIGRKDGDLRYANKAFPLGRNSNQMQTAMERVRSILGQMRKALRLCEVPKGTPTPRKCRACTFRNQCPEAAS